MVGLGGADFFVFDGVKRCILFGDKGIRFSRCAWGMPILLRLANWLTEIVSF